jgi:mono/diheme cytochrome c family protein
MFIEHRSRSGRASLALLALTLSVAACDFVPDDGYDKVASRVREDVGIAAAPPPPAYTGPIGGGAGAVPQLAANAPAGVTQAMVETGAQQFSTVCAACHGAGGVGTAAAPALNDAQWLNVSGAFEEIVTVINNGVPNPKEHPAPMPPRGGGNFTEEQVRALGAYVFALSHAGP